MKIGTSTMHESANYQTLDERNHIEKPFLDQLHGLGWEIIDLDNKRTTWTPVSNFARNILPCC